MGAFVGTRVQEAVWPEGLGVGAYALSQLVAASVDGAIKDKIDYPITQTGTTALALGVGIRNVGANVAPDFSKGLIYGAGVGLVVNLVRGLYELVRKEPVRTRLTDIAALVPRKVGVLPAGNKGGGVTFKLDKGTVLKLAGNSPGNVETEATKEKELLAQVITRRGM